MEDNQSGRKPRDERFVRHSERAGKLPVDPREMASPLYSAEAEKAVLGSMLSRPDIVMEQVESELKRSDFFVPSHQEIFECLRELHHGQRAIDIMTVHQWLLDRKLAEAVGSPGVLAELAAGVATHLNVTTHIQFVQDKSILRHLQEACCNIVQDITDAPDKVTRIVDSAERSIMEISREGTAFKETPWAETMKRTMMNVEKFQLQGKKVTGLPTGLWRLDDYTTGWQGGQMIVLGARPGVGKTALCMKFLMHLLNKRYGPDTGENGDQPLPCQMFSMEMSGEELGTRFLSMHSGVKMQKLRTGNIKDMDEKAMMQAEREMKAWPLHVDDSGRLDVMQFRARLRRAVKKYGIRFAVVDYIQLMRCNTHSKNRQEEVSEISRTIKMTARELNIPIFVNAQLQRPKDEGGENERPQLHNLRESGAIEQDADIVLLLHNRNEILKKYKVYDLILAKQRSGPTGELRIGYCGGEVLFEELPDVPEAVEEK